VAAGWSDSNSAKAAVARNILIAAWHMLSRNRPCKPALRGRPPRARRADDARTRRQRRRRRAYDRLDDRIRARVIGITPRGSQSVRAKARYLQWFR
jgi:hypothetical protein